MALWELVQTRRGKETVVERGDLPKVRDRMRQLRQSQRGGVGMRRKDPVSYAIRRAEPGAEKLAHTPHGPTISGQGSGHPRVPQGRRGKGRGKTT